MTGVSRVIRFVVILFFHEDKGHNKHKDTEDQSNNGTYDISTVAILIYYKFVIKPLRGTSLMLLRG